MRGTFRLLVAAFAASTLAACAAITGLDKITEDDCAPNGCPDVGNAAEASREAAASDASPGPDASAVDSGAGPEAAGGDATRDAPVDPADSAAETGVDAREDGGTDAGLDGDATSKDAEAGPSDATSEMQPLADTGPDSPCGTVYVHETFDGTTPGWTLDSTWSVAPTCASPPAPQKGHPDPSADHTTSSTGGGVAAAYACGNNPVGATAPARYATSPAVDVSAAPSLKLAFYRWLNSDASDWMTSTVDIYDGTAWVNVYTNPAGAGNIVADAAWTRFEYDVTAYKNAAFRVRFGYAITSTGVYAMSCWNVDDLTLSTLSCQ
jgi:hypothetical protein